MVVNPHNSMPCRQQAVSEREPQRATTLDDAPFDGDGKYGQDDSPKKPQEFMMEQ